MSVPRNEIGPSKSYAFVDPSSVNYDIRANDPSGQKRSCREILVLAAGTIQLTMTDGTTTTSTNSIAAGVSLPVEAVSIVAAGTSATEVLVMW